MSKNNVYRTRRNKKYKLYRKRCQTKIDYIDFDKIRKIGLKLSIGGIIVFVVSRGLINTNDDNLKNHNNIEIKQTLADSPTFEYSTEIITEMSTEISTEMTEITTEMPIETTTIDDFALENRLKTINSDGRFMIGSNVSKINLESYVNSYAGQCFLKYANQYGIDPYLLIALASQETFLDHYSYLPGSDLYNGYGVGICQLESPSGQEITAYNYETNEEDTEYVTMDNAEEIENNIQIAAMRMQNFVHIYNGNPYLTIQSYNYGSGMINMALRYYSNKTGKSVEDIKNDYQDLGWLNYIKDMHENPGDYLSDWNFNTYGDGDYIEHVLQYFPGSKTYYNYDGKRYEIDLNNGDILKIDHLSQKAK